MPKYTLEEKRLETLRRQLHGKAAFSYSGGSSSEKSPSGGAKSTASSLVTDPSYLRSDLLKIFIFSAIAVGVELFLFLGSKNHLFNLGF